MTREGAAEEIGHALSFAGAPDPSTETLRLAAHALRTFGPMLEAVAGLGVECIRDGRTAPAEGCDCDTCHDFAEVGAALALALARKETA